ncbi:MAG: HNH endonuclease [Oscillospiraceae bacterium]|nr:HNH endonuclease [Oscillospiraceae bacterium]
MKEYARKFYLSKAWRSTREAYYRYRCGVCERCGAAGDIVHHKIYLSPSNIRDPKIALSFDNLELLCQDCHNKEHLERQNERYSFDKNGNITPPARKFGGSSGNR